MLTGKAKEDFEKWYKNTEIWEYYQFDEFYEYLSDSMQYGVYVDWFDSVGIYLEVACMAEGWQSEVWLREVDRVRLDYCNHIENGTRHEARTKAIEKANEIYNDEQDKL